MRARLTSLLSPSCRPSSAREFPSWPRSIVMCRSDCELRNNFPTALFNFITKCRKRQVDASQIPDHSSFVAKQCFFGAETDGADRGSSGKSMGPARVSRRRFHARKHGAVRVGVAAKSVRPGFAIHTHAGPLAAGIAEAVVECERAGLWIEVQ